MAFQAADLLAWRTRRLFEDSRKLTLTQEIAQTLYASFSEAWQSPHHAFYGDRVRLERFCIDERIPKRL